MSRIPRAPSTLLFRAFVSALLLVACKSVSSDQPKPPTPPTVAAPGASQTSGAPAPPIDDAGVRPNTPPLANGKPDAAVVVQHNADDNDGGAPESADAGPWVPPDPECTGKDWRVAPGLLPAKHVDYIADRDLRFPDAGPPDQPQPVNPELVVVSSAGMACANATDRAACETALALNPQFGRHLVTTSGDSVRIWPAPAMPLLGVIDTPAEAVWMVIVTRGPLTCDATITRDDDGFLITGLPNWSCPQLPDGGQVLTASTRVLPDGGVMDILTDAGTSAGACE